MRLISWLAPSLGLAMLLGGGFFWFIADHAPSMSSGSRLWRRARAQAELIQLAQIAGGTSLLRINVERVRTQIMQTPVDSEALVRRVYPNELEVIVYESVRWPFSRAGTGI